MNYRQQILDALKAKFQGVSDSVLGRIADKLSKTVTSAEQVTTAVEGVTLQQLIDGYADSRATEAAQTAVNNYERNHNLKDGKPVEVQQPGGQQGQPAATVITPPTAGGADTVPAWAKTLTDGMTALTERLNNMEHSRTTETRKQQLANVISKLPENLRKSYERTAIDSLKDDEFTTLLGEITTEVDGIAAELNAKGAVFGKPAAGVGGGSQQNGQLSKEQEAAIAVREGKPKDGQQPF
jgi:hypothetical protein